MRLFEIKPSDRKMTRYEWKHADRMARQIGREVAPEIDKALLSLAITGSAAYHVNADGKTRALSWQEMVELMPERASLPLPSAPLSELGFEPD